MGMVRVKVKKLVLAASVSLLMAPAAQAGLLSKWDELTVKGGELESCPSVTLEQQADSFFKEPEWSAGKAADGRKLVNVSGTFTYGDRPVRGLLQMWVQGEEFSVEALEINGQPQPDVMIDALLSKMCEAAKSQQPKEGDEKAQARADLPFVGKRRFNFSGGSGTAEFITIQSNGHTVVESCGSECSIDFEGPFTNPLKTQYGIYRVEAKRIFELDDKGQGKTCQKALGDPRDTKCSVELYAAQ
ncbi:hypothetical protein AMS64_14170 [Aeromonas veronii]|uniref:hypothetical protein n=1 Tax=Aeromonas veronii TaxID=654 RepID=UPI00078E4484|nr:hypothetical protein [Aeromonas veronii]AMQ43414.1 hypothetical protein AMS64_14170 [Aeromonas veronii]MCX0429158.1 hypothetical protein [Aeromonas veronii]MCX0450034.1 hypothetical protein [Aeromonas veronii]POG18606.1 hypothetical protein C2849_14210 [Aeromonas veronii]